MKHDGDSTTLSSGRIFYSFCGRLHPEPGGRLTYGHDGKVREVAELDTPVDELCEDQSPLTSVERREIADAQIARWNRWAETGSPE
jgi:hypothetical protein